jgi:3-oxoacyl-[acyl-carrier-protein] synthase II
MSAERVVITGLSMITPLGVNEEAWRALLAGTSGLREITSFDTSAYRVHKGGEVLDFDPTPYCRRIDSRRIDRSSLFAVAAARMAYADSGLEDAGLDVRRAGVAVGSIVAAGNELLGQVSVAAERGFPHLSRLEVGKLLGSRVPAAVAAELGFAGPNVRFDAACASGNYAIAYGADLLRYHDLDVVLAGSGDAYLQLAFTGFAAVRAIAPDVCRPFDKDRDGMMVSEGAAALVLERLSHAQARGARIYAEVLGYGLGCDAYHMTSPEPGGIAGAHAILRALDMADLSPRDVDYVNAHGTGTVPNDLAEAVIFRRVFGEHLPHVPISSTKSMIGHTMGSASAIEAVICALAIRDNILPPTINFNQTDLGDDFDFVPNNARQHETRVVLNNANGFGGNICAVLLGRFAA